MVKDVEGVFVLCLTLQDSRKIAIVNTHIQYDDRFTSMYTSLMEAMTDVRGYDCIYVCGTIRIINTYHHVVMAYRFWNEHHLISACIWWIHESPLEHLFVFLSCIVPEGTHLHDSDHVKEN